MSKIIPTGDHVLVTEFTLEDKKAGKIVVPDNIKKAVRYGKVEAVGEGRMLESGKICEPRVKKGDKVMFRENEGTEITFQNKRYILLTVYDVIARIE